MAGEAPLTHFSSFVDRVSSKPEDFFTSSEPLAEAIKTNLKRIFDLNAARAAEAGTALPLEELFVEGFDAEQIWAELELAHGPLVTNFKRKLLVALKAAKEANFFPALEAGGKGSKKQQAAAKSSSSKKKGGAASSEEEGFSSTEEDEATDSEEGSEEEEEEEEDEHLARIRRRAEAFDSDDDDDDDGSEEDGDDEDDEDDEGEDEDDESGSQFSVGSMEDFIAEGETEMKRMQALKEGKRPQKDKGSKQKKKGKQRGSDSDSGSDSGSGSEDEDKEGDDFPLDYNQPIEDDALPASLLQSDPGKKLSEEERKARIAALLASAPTAEEVFGISKSSRSSSKKGNLSGSKRGRASANAEDDDGELDEKAALFGKKKAAAAAGKSKKARQETEDEDDDEEEDDDADSFSSGGSDDQYIDEGLGKAPELEDEDEEEEEEEDSEEEGSSSKGKKAGKQQQGKASKKKLQWADQDDEEEEEEEVGSGSDAMEEEEEEDEGGEKKQPKLSRHQQEKARLAQQIAGMEASMLQGKHWSLLGEISSTSRPQNSLLAADLDYEQAVKAAPKITKETTVALEELIKQRIADQAWDDPLPREDSGSSVAAKKDDKDLPQLSSDRSKEGLGELYAKQFESTVLGAATAADTAVSKAEAEAAELMKSLFSKLDALCNFFYAPKPPSKEDITTLASAAASSAVPAVQMEEVLPSAVSEAAAQAPEEQYERKKGREGVLRSAAEKTAEERAAARRARKEAGRKEKAQKEEEKAVKERRTGIVASKSKQEALQDLRKGAARSGTKIIFGGSAAARAAVMGGPGAAAGAAGGKKGGAAGGAGGGKFPSAALQHEKSSEYGKSTAIFQRLQMEAQQNIRQTLGLADSGPTVLQGGGKQKSGAGASKATSFKL